MESFIILSIIWYERLTKCYLLHTDLSKFRDWRRYAKQHGFFLFIFYFLFFFIYQLWTARALLNTLLGLPNHNSQSSPDEIHELGLWVENEMICHELEPWVWWDNIAVSYGPWASTLYCVNMGSFGL